MTLLGLGLGIAEVLRLMGNAVSVGTVELVSLLLIFGSQFTLFAMWFDGRQRPALSREEGLELPSLTASRSRRSVLRLVGEAASLLSRDRRSARSDGWWRISATTSRSSTSSP